MNKKIITIALLVLMASIVVTAPLETLAQNSNLGISILQVTPTSKSGPVGTAVNVQGTLYINNGNYELSLISGGNKVVVTSGKADGYYVNANFTVPELSSGTYALSLRDVGIDRTSTADSFTITTGYSIAASSDTIQEGSSATLTVSVTGASAAQSYYAKVKVSLPNSGTTYTKNVLLGVPNAKGTASAQITFPASTFDPQGSSTAYAGSYSYSFNDSLASNQFTVSFLDQTTYHRGQTVNIRAIGYQADQAATITVVSVKTGTTLDTIQTAASSEGVITASYVLSQTADIGDYRVTINPTGTQKTIVDQQTFSVAGYTVRIQTTNLAGEAVPDVSVQAMDGVTSTVSTATSDENGYVSFKFEKGTVALSAQWNGINVGSQNITITGEGTFTMKCQLTNLRITVKNVNGVVMPFVDLNIQYNYQGNVQRTGSAQGQTGPSGSYTLKSALAGATYKVDASVYNQIFNSANNTFSNLPSQATVDVVIICPTKDIAFTIFGFNQAAIPDARIELVELSNGLFYSATTDSSGAASAQLTFGMYRARVYKANALVNETTVEAFSSGQKQITCTLYGIQVLVKVVDAFGSPISNADVTINGPQQLSRVTQGDGVATFDNIIGGTMQIIAQAQGTPEAYQAITTTVNQPGTVQIKMEKYLSLGSTLIPSTLLVTIAIILLALAVLAVVEVARRKVKPTSSS